MAKEKLDIKRQLKAVDTRDHNFYTNLSDDEKKECTPYVLMRFTANVSGDRELQEWFVETTNEYVNKHHWTLSKDHKNLLWKLMASTGIGQPLFHQYLASGKKAKAQKIEKLLAEIYPSYKMEDIQVMASLMSKADIDELFDKMGFDKAQRKEYE